MPADEFERTVEQLYAGPPDQFIAQRDAAVKQARSAGDKELADRLKALRRPTVAAALLNQLHRHDGAGLDDLLELGEKLRAAQSKLDAKAMKSLSTERNVLVSRLVSQIADSSDEQLSATVHEQLSDTLVAAVADAAAGRAVGSGRLVSGLRYSGFGEVDLQDAVAIPLQPQPEASAVTPGDEDATETPPEPPEPAEEAERRRAQQQADAERQVAEATAALSAARTSEESAQQAAEFAERALAAARRTAKNTRSRAEQATASRSAAEEALAAAQAAAARPTES